MLLVRKKLPALLLAVASILCFTVASPAFAQQWHRCGPGGPMEHDFHRPNPGRWWDNPKLAQKIGLTDAQKKQMDGIFFKHRLQLVDLKAALQKDEILLRPMISADQPNEAKVLAQIDTIAQDRANLEKANARMLFGIRRVLTAEQWTKLKAIVHHHHEMMEHRWRHQWHGRGGPGAPPPPPDAGAAGPGGPPPASGTAPAQPPQPNQ